MTVYFINQGIGASNSGIEHAEFDRARIFRRNNVPFKLVTSEFNRKLHNILPMFALSDKESMNMFDYFQKALSIPSQPLTLHDMDFGFDMYVEQSEDKPSLYNVFLGENQKHFMGRIILDTQNAVEQAEMFDLVGNLYKVIQYDSRGFQSLVQYYSPKGQVELEIWYDVDGKPVIEKTYEINRRGEMTETWKVGQLLFRSLQDLRGYFYNLLNDDGLNMFIIDRANVSEYQLLSLDKPAYIVFMLHNHQSSDPQNPNAEVLNNNYEWSMANIDAWDCIVSATPEQTRDIKARWGEHLNAHTIPVGVIPDYILQTPPKPMNERKPYSMLVTARVAVEKGIDKMIQALAIAQETIPELTLDVFGYVDHGDNDIAQTRIDESLKLLSNPNSVVLHEHSKDVHKEHDTHQLYLIFSYMEGFNLALMEAQSAGMVGLTNDVSYGPNHIIKDGENGYIVGYDDVQAYADKMVELFQNPDKLQAMSDKAFELSRRYSESNVWDKWEEVFDQYDEWKESKKNT